MNISESSPLRVFHILLADDDTDDCLLFRDALEQLPVSANLTTVHDGDQLMQLLSKTTGALPDVLFLDLNMPRKNGFTCLEEIKRKKSLQHLPVIIFSTSYAMDTADGLYKNGAQYYICKPPTFADLKEVIHRALILINEFPVLQPHRSNFLLNKPKGMMV